MKKCILAIATLASIYSSAGENLGYSLMNPNDDGLGAHCFIVIYPAVPNSTFIPIIQRYRVSDDSPYNRDHWREGTGLPCAIAGSYAIYGFKKGLDAIGPHSPAYYRIDIYQGYGTTIDDVISSGEYLKSNASIPALFY